MVVNLTKNWNKVPTSNTYSYLGVIFSNANDRFGENYENKHDKALRAIYAARNLAHNAIGPDVAPTMLFKIFDTQIQPIIDYSGEVCYDRKVKRRLESLQTVYLKRAPGVKVQTSNLAIFGETGRYPLFVRQEKLVLGHWVKLMILSPTNPLLIVNDELYRLSTTGNTIGALMSAIY